VGCTLGARYYDYDEDRVLTSAASSPRRKANVPGSVDSDGFSPRFIMSYDVSGPGELNGQISRGFRLGGINDR
jgi:iron complex outermembrane receptor protein